HAGGRRGDRAASAGRFTPGACRRDSLGEDLSRWCEAAGHWGGHGIGAWVSRYGKKHSASQSLGTLNACVMVTLSFRVALREGAIDFRTRERSVDFSRGHG